MKLDDSWRVRIESGGKIYPLDPLKRDVFRQLNLTVFHGECLGFLGRNGSGKSTILKVIAGVSDLTTGRCEVRGTILPMLEVGIGFNPELSCVDNIILYNALIGLDPKLSKSKINSVFEFAELIGEERKPVKFLSSGQYMRLAFAVAVVQCPDVLLIDEVLAVGDPKFQKKCISKVIELKRSSAILFVSHNLDHIRKLCDRCIVIDEGRVCFEGKTVAAIEFYENVILGE